MGLTIVSQFGEALDSAIAALPCVGSVVVAPAEAPWHAAQQADVLLVHPLSVWRKARNMPPPEGWPGCLRWVLSGSTGVDAYPRWLLDAPLFSCGRGLAVDTIADYVIAAVFLHSKNLQTVTVNAPEQWGPMPLGHVVGSTFGLIGYGAIGKGIARRALALGANVIAFRRQLDAGADYGVTLLDTPGDVVAAADHIIIALPATPATSRLIDEAVLSRARPHAHLINISRGSVIDQAALLKALDESRISFATLDVTDPEPLPAAHPFWTHPGVRLTPHLSSFHPLIFEDLLQFTLSNLERFARGEPPEHLVNPVQGY